MSEPRQYWRIPTGGERVKVIERIGRFLHALPADQSFSVTVQQHKPKRSNEQNAYLWGVVYPTVLKVGGEQLRGWTADELHEYCLGEWSGWETLTGFGRKKVRPMRRSSALNKQEFSDYIEFIKRRMAEHGIYVPDAGEDLEHMA